MPDEKIGPYLEACEEAANRDEAFGCFKRDSRLTAIWEHVDEAGGKVYARSIEDIPVRMPPHAIGGASHIVHRHYVASPTYFRYAFVLSEIVWPAKGTKHILEIGGGYGGQAHVLTQNVQVDSYTILDLPPVCRLQSRYLKACGVNNVVPVSDYRLLLSLEYDLVISNYAYDELERATQEAYLPLLEHSKRGYITANNCKEWIWQHLPGAKWKYQEPEGVGTATIMRW